MKNEIDNVVWWIWRKKIIKTKISLYKTDGCFNVVVVVDDGDDNDVQFQHTHTISKFKKNRIFFFLLTTTKKKWFQLCLFVLFQQQQQQQPENWFAKKKRTKKKQKKFEHRTELNDALDSNEWKKIIFFFVLFQFICFVFFFSLSLSLVAYFVIIHTEYSLWTRQNRDWKKIYTENVHKKKHFKHYANI